ncbi:hypothetical protein C8R43DRAFT_442281 [Mycena crocata]|nr:hypothetical protein C8R43DRAFT_442281 [Mycena crocata]
MCAYAERFTCGEKETQAFARYSYSNAENRRILSILTSSPLPRPFPPSIHFCQHLSCLAALHTFPLTIVFSAHAPNPTRAYSLCYRRSPLRSLPSSGFFREQLSSSVLFSGAASLWRVSCGSLVKTLIASPILADRARRRTETQARDDAQALQHCYSHRRRLSIFYFHEDQLAETLLDETVPPQTSSLTMVEAGKWEEDARDKQWGL